MMGKFFNHGLTRIGSLTLPGFCAGASRQLKKGQALAQTIRVIRGLILAMVSAAMAFTAFAAEPTVSVTAKQRYPWNGLVDVAFTITGESGTKYDTSFTAKDVAGGTNLTMKTIYKSDGSSAALTNALAVGSYKWVWNAAADLPDGFKCDRVTVTGDIDSEGDKKRYMVVNLSTGAIEYLRNPPAGGWLSDPYLKTRMVLKRIEPGMFSQASGSGSVRNVTITRPFYVSLYPLTACQGRTVGFRCSCDFVVNWSAASEYSDVWRDSTVTALFGTWPSHENHFYLIEYLSSYYGSDLIAVVNSKTGMSFSIPTEAQMTLARSTIDIGSTWTFVSDYWHSDLGNDSVEDPFSDKSGATVVGWYTRRACISKMARGYEYSFENGSGNQVVVRLCYVVK